MRLTVIGSSPAWPNAGGAHSGYLVSSNGKRLLLDCGPGVLGRLREKEEWPLLDAIAITHFHLDHWGDLVPWVWGSFYRRGHDDVRPELWVYRGGRAFLEQTNLVLNRLTGRAQQGFLLTLVGEREQNDSDRQFGTVGVFETRLPSGFWRGRGHLEWYLPQSDSMTWEIAVDGSLTDKKDRVYNYDAQKPIETRVRVMPTASPVAPGW